MSKRSRMTVDIPVKLREKIKEAAGLKGKTLSQYVALTMQNRVYYLEARKKQVFKLLKLNDELSDLFKVWRFIAVVLFIALIILACLKWV